MMKIEEKKIHKVALDALITYGLLISENTTPEDLNRSLEVWYKDSVALMKDDDEAWYKDSVALMKGETYDEQRDKN